MSYPNLRAEIARAGMTPTSLGRLIGKDASAMSAIMSGKAAISLELAMTIKKNIGTSVPIEELFEKCD